MKRLALLPVIVLALLVAASFTLAAAPPNIVFILVDDTGWNALDVPADPDIPGSGSTYYQTPQTSKLALSGIRFSMAYSPAPTCGPSRTSIQYGQSPSTVGKFAEEVPRNLPPARDAMIRRLKAAHPEYRAAHFGKWHQRTRTPEEIGYDESDGQTMNGEGNKCPEGDPKLTFSLARKANDFMTRQAKAGRPFFVQVSFYANHLKYMALPETIKKYEGMQDKATPYQNSPLWAAMHEDMDRAVGSIVDTVEKLGIRDNTYFIYTADNGYEFKKDSGKPVAQRTFHKAHPLLSHKYMISEGGLRVPFLVSGPGIPAGASSRVPVVGWDIMPTVLDMAGAADQIPGHVEGGSLLPLCQSGGKATVKRRDPFMVFRYTKRNNSLDIAIVQDGYKFLREISSGNEHLWSLWDDLGEQNNLIAKMPEKAERMRQNMDGYFQRLGWDQKEHVNLKPPKKSKKPKAKPAASSVATQFKAHPSHILIADFEGKGYGGWRAEGEAFGQRPATGNVTPHNKVTGYLGKGLVNSFMNGDQTTGTLTSPEFTIERKRINFLIGAGSHKGKTCMNLLVNGKPVRTATGCARKDAQKCEIMLWHSWDVAEFAGKKAVLQIVDNHSGGWGHINIDHIFQSDRVVKGAVVQKHKPTAKSEVVLLHGADRVIGEREIKIKGKYLLVPVSKTITPQAFRGADKAMQEQLDVFVDGVLVHSPSVDLAHDKNDISFWGQLDMSEYVGKKAKLRMWVLNANAKQAVPDDSRALAMIDTDDKPRADVLLYKEKLRPQLRFSQMRGWNNDPNGMLYYDGEYHLFWQANPVGLAHANMYWGHAVSRDLIHWKELPEALRPFAEDTKKIHPALAVGHCHSGGGAVDFNNTGGWQTGDDKTLLVTFTDTGMKSGRTRDLPGFSESLAYSVDKGRTWKIWEGNPIIRHLGRDPKLFWFEEGKHWSIAVYNEQEGVRGIAFYKSTDLKSWERTGKLDGFYECPEIVQAPVNGADGETKWAMFGADGQYVVGDFNGEVIVPEHEGKYRFIYGGVYAGQCFSDAPDGRVIYIGWARGLALPGMPFSQGFTLPLELTLHQTPNGVRMRGYPVKEFDWLRSGELFSVSDKRLAAGETISFESSEDLADIQLTVTPSPEAEELVLTLGDVTIGYDFKTGRVQGLRSRKGNRQEVAAAHLTDGKMQIRVVVDRPMCEVFFNEGEVYALIPKSGGEIGSITLKTEGTVDDLKVYGMRSIWE